jgi:hypothetical protein
VLKSSRQSPICNTNTNIVISQALLRQFRIEGRDVCSSYLSSRNRKLMSNEFIGKMQDSVSEF